MTTTQRTFSILAMTAFVGLALNTTDAMARGNNRHTAQSNKQVVHVVERTVVHKHIQPAPSKAPSHVNHRAPQRTTHKVQHVVHHTAPAPLGISISNGHVSISLPGIHIN